MREADKTDLNKLQLQPDASSKQECSLTISLPTANGEPGEATGEAAEATLQGSDLDSVDDGPQAEWAQSSTWSPSVAPGVPAQLLDRRPGPRAWCEPGHGLAVSLTLGRVVTVNDVGTLSCFLVSLASGCFTHLYTLDSLPCGPGVAPGEGCSGVGGGATGGGATAGGATRGVTPGHRLHPLVARAGGDTRQGACVCFSSGGTLLLATGSCVAEVDVVAGVHTGYLLAPQRTDADPGAEVWGVACSGPTAVVGLRKGAMLVMDTASRTVLRTLQQIPWGDTLRLSRDGACVAVGHGRRDAVSMHCARTGAPLGYQWEWGDPYYLAFYGLVDTEECDEGWLVANESCVFLVPYHANVQARHQFLDLGKSPQPFLCPSSLALVPGQGLVVRSSDPHGYGASGALQLFSTPWEGLSPLRVAWMGTVVRGQRWLTSVRVQRRRRRLRCQPASVGDPGAVGTQAVSADVEFEAGWTAV